MEMLNALESEQQFDDLVEDDDDVYEQIEAPKYVDFTRPDQFLIDDRSWFCLRIGCDQNHEDVDPDALHKSFVLRVMAARSPNLKLRKALRSRQVPSAYMKYPMSAPAKPSKPRICRFTAMTLVSQKIADVKVKARPISKNSSTPTMKPMKSYAAGKSLTTPRVKKSIPASDPFRSVRNPQRTDAPLQSKVVAKELIFNTPKKSERKKYLVETETPVAAICDRMKNLQLHSQRKKPSTNVSQASRSTAGRPKKSRPASDSSTSELYRQRLKSQVKDSTDHKDQEVKSSNYLKSTKTKSAKKFGRLSLRSVANSDMDIDGESRNGSFGVCSVSGASKSNVGSGNKEESDLLTTTLGVTVTIQEESLPSTQPSLIGENLQEVLANVSNYPNAMPLSNHGKVSEARIPNGDVEPDVSNGNEHGSGLDLRDSKERDDSGVTKTSAKALVFNTPEISKNDGSLLESETPLTDICDGLKKLEINSQVKKPTWNSNKSSRCTVNRPKKSRTAADPSTSKLHSQKLRITDSEDRRDLEIKTSKRPKSKSTKVSQKSRCSIEKENDGESRRGSFGVCPASETSKSKEENGNEQQSDLSMTTQEESLPSLETVSVEENVQVLPDVSNCPEANSLPKSKKISEEEYLPDHQIPNGEGDIQVSKGDEDGIGHELKVSGERDDCTRVMNASEEKHLPSSKTHLESEVMKDEEDKENTAASDNNRNANFYSHQSQGCSLPSENHENQLKVIHAEGKPLKGHAAVATGSSLLRKYKKTKPTNPKPFRLRTDERGILREANLEKRHPPAPLKEISTVSLILDGHAQKRHANDRNEEKVKSRRQFRQEGVAQEVNQIEADKRIQIQQEQTKAKTSKTEVELKTATTSARGQIKREFRTTKSQLLRQQLIRTQSRGNEPRKTKAVISLVPSRRLSIIKEKPSTILRQKDGKPSHKGTFRSSPRVKIPTTIPKEPKFHTTPKACRKIASLLK